MSKPLLPSEKEVLLWQDKSEKAVLARLEKHYKDALKSIEEKITAMLGRYDANLPNVIRRIEYQRLLKEQIQTVLERLHSNEYETISQYLTDSYTDAFVGTMYTLHQQDVPLILPIDQSVVMKAVTLDSKLKEPLYKSTGKDITQLKKTISEEVTRGIATGLQYSDIARNLRNAANIPLGRAKTIARTEAGRVQEQATFDAAEEAKAAGADVVKQWSSRRDGTTRDAHRMLDGQIREVNEPFTVNGAEAMHPHGFGVAALDINCRCTMLTRARAALGEDTLKQLEERAYQHGLLAKDKEELGRAQVKNIAEFKRKYLKAAETEGQKSSVVRDLMDKAAKGETLTDEEYARAGHAVRESVLAKTSERKKQIDDLIDKYTKERDSIEDEAFEALMAGNDSSAILKKEGEIAKKLAELRTELADVDRRTMKEELSKYRTIGFGSSAEKEKFIDEQFSYGVGMGDFHKARKREIMEAFAETCDYYPTDWLKKSVNYGKIVVERQSRGAYNHSTKTIFLSYQETTDFATAFHEMAHRFEAVVPGLLGSEKTYYQSRTEGEPLVPLASFGGNYEPREMTRVDRFVHPYMGKDYGGRSYELCSMGFEYVYTNPDEIAKDPDMYDWLVGLLVLK